MINGCAKYKLQQWGANLEFTNEKRNYIIWMQQYYCKIKSNFNVVCLKANFSSAIQFNDNGDDGS